ncbi:hydroxysqualene dehydroxylase [Magnetospirillum gryphiswaldense]|uniref:hydroxysqualene dehydroxylase n=1 Tax=Magnetospirillum gryphiswaldense TaxID=55518 RepID=UPI000D03EBB3|nr:FAD-dependent oxidoreductase [Magnetospirillum gryphiswaldense]AVM73538.1 hypothetical protein MSR1_10390 [Magnetospirillum gryphiswaldense MSR-1]AVM77441.1 hypothetical protein MSR1L_10390 [Magnetospirillum gryphiswaldense]
MKPVVHVVGAGLAGLAAAQAVARSGHAVHLYEAAPQAGGRCRSFHDPVLDRVIDNGSHLLLGVNRVALDYLKASGGLDFVHALPPRIHFAHVGNGHTWTASPTRLPVSAWEVLRAVWPGDGTVAQRLGSCRGFADFWQPLCLAIMNTAPADADSRLFARVLRAILRGGRAGFRGYAFPHGLSAALIDPALARLGELGAGIHFGQRLISISQQWLTFAERAVSLASHDRVILALPPWALSPLLPEQDNFDTETIANVHFRLPHAHALPHPLGLIGGMGQWLFVRGDVASVTLSAAQATPDAAILWREIAPVLDLPIPTPPHRVVQEKRATLRHTPSSSRRRPGPTTGRDGVFLAGDWLASPWPCTMESAISSGLAAARLALGRDDLRFS